MLLIPTVIGEAAGKHVAQKSEERIIKMCTDSKNCARLEFAGKVIAIGYIIDASESRIAIFDPVTRATSIHNTDGTAIIRRRLQAGKPLTDQFGPRQWGAVCAKEITRTDSDKP